MDKRLLDIYSDYLISQSHYATATGLADLLNGEISHDKISRFLRLEDYESKELWQYVKPSVRQHEASTCGVLVLDDTISEKHYTDENAINCWHFSHAKHRHVKGINLLSCLVRYDDIALPIGYEIVKKDTQYSDLATRKLKRKAAIGKNDLFRSLIQQAVKNEVLFDYILADNSFGSKANMTFIEQDLKKHFIVGIKSNRCIAMTEEAKSGQFQQVNSLDWKDGDCNTVYLKDLAFPVKLLKKIFTNEDGSTGVLYLATNDLTIDADRIYEVYQKRWRIEEFHKSIKQNASLSKSPTKIIRTQANHLFASMIAYCKLELLKVKTSMNHFAIRQKLLLKANQIMFNELQLLKAAA
ncbi:MAG: transposase [Gammaproteobacteria bacterium]|nr:transposase [Gammaproteobacteria bacterium]MCD8542683.1 transposase [Gammaproteobacteria bacterium]MCD8573721.1 transposase [Gammaproteobacteria bacterium]